MAKLFYARSDLGSWWVAAQEKSDVRLMIFEYEGNYTPNSAERAETVREVECIQFSKQDASCVVLENMDCTLLEAYSRMCNRSRNRKRVGVICPGKH